MLAANLQVYYGLPIFIGLATILAFVYRAYDASRFSGQIPRVREKSGEKRFGLLTRLAFYFDCRNLYADVWHNVCVPSHVMALPLIVPSSQNMVLLCWFLLWVPAMKSSCLTPR